MKNKITLIITTLFLIVAGCNKEENYGIPVYFPKPGSPDANIMAVRGWQPWGAFGEGAVNSNQPNEYFWLRFSTHTEEGFQRESIVIREIPLKTGVFEVRKRTVPPGDDGFVDSWYALSRDDGDVGGDFFELDEDSDGNELEVTYIDTIAGVVRGKFNLNFIRSSGSNPNYPDKIKFRNGVFEVGFFE